VWDLAPADAANRGRAWRVAAVRIFWRDGGVWCLWPGSQLETHSFAKRALLSETQGSSFVCALDDLFSWMFLLIVRSIAAVGLGERMAWPRSIAPSVSPCMGWHSWSVSASGLLS